MSTGILAVSGSAAILTAAFHFGSWWGLLGGAGVVLLAMALEVSMWASR